MCGSEFGKASIPACTRPVMMSVTIGAPTAAVEVVVAGAARPEYQQAALLTALPVHGAVDAPLTDPYGTAAYGLWPCRHTPSEVLSSGIHNRDERLHVDDLAYGLDFTLHVCREVGALTR